MTTTNATQTDIIDRDGVLSGPYRAPRNLAANQRGSIHDDATAQKLGFRGGTVAGSIHMEQFPPLMLHMFGPRWFETGTLSCYFRNATTDREPVRTLADAPAAAENAQTRIWMERDDGTLVLEGTASAGAPAQPSWLRAKLDERREPGEQRMLARLQPGDETRPVIARVTEAEARPRLRAITEPLGWYEGSSPWGGAILNPGLLVHLLVHAQEGMQLDRAGAVGLYGAIEVRHINGPAFMEHDYEVGGKILAVGQTPKTEYIWYESTARNRGDPAPVADMLMMLRFMKASSQHWR
jgi:hypothetical protein